jgi:hypothetical protein
LAANPLPVDLADAFGAAILYFRRDWTADNPDEPCVPVNDRALSMRLICQLIIDSDDSLPASTMAAW